MFGIEPLVLGVVFLALGLGAVGVTRLLAEVAARRSPPAVESAPPPVIPLDLKPSENAVIITQAGGKIDFANELAREWLGLDGGEPDLHQVASRARPTDLFLELCAAEGEARLSLGGQAVQATSHRVPLPSGPGMVIVMRQIGEDQPAEQVRAADELAFQTVSQISQAITGSVSLEDTIQDILRGAHSLLPADIVEINLWNESTQTLTPYRYGTLRSTEFEAATEGDIYQVGEGYTGWLAHHRRPLLIPDVHQRKDLGPKIDRGEFPFNAYLGVPLLFGDQFLGTIELANLQPNAYDHTHKTLLQILGAQAATALHNARLHEQQHRRADELAGLSELVQAVGSLTDVGELFGRLAQGIARLLEVEILGFLLYDEVSQNLVGQIPFVGIPEPFVDRYYQIPSSPDGATAAIWQARDHWLSNNVENDPEVDAIGFRALAQAASIQNTLIVPIVSGGRRIGIIQAANKRDNRSFDEDDIRLLSILAGQSAPLIENAQLVEEARRRAERAEGLRRVTALAASAATVDEILTYALRELGRLLRVELAALLLVDEAKGRLRPHPDSLLGIDAHLANELLTLSTNNPQFQTTVTRSQRPILSNQALQEARSIPSLHGFLNRFDVESVIDIPLVVQDSGIGEILLAKTSGEGFTNNDLELAITFAGQIAGAVERARLSAQTDTSLRRRVDQLTALTRVSRELNATLELEPLIGMVHEEALRTTEADCGRTVLLNLEEDGAAPSVALIIGDDSGSGELNPLELEVLASGAMRTLGDFASEELPPPHAGIRSSLLAPIAYHGQTAGMIHLHGSRRNQFDEGSAQIAEGLAIQAAIAIGNAQRYQEQSRRAELLRRRSEALSQISYISSAVRSDASPGTNLETIAYGLQAASGFNRVSLDRLDEESNLLRNEVSAGLEEARKVGEETAPQPWEAVEELLQDQYKVSRSYFIPHDRVPIENPELYPSSLLAIPPKFAWQTGDQLLVPLFGIEGQVLGVVRLEDPRTGLRPDRETIETIEIFANQAAITIENAALHSGAEEAVEALVEELDELRASHAEMGASSRKLLEETTRSNQEIETHRERAQVVQSLAQVVEVASAQSNDASIFQTFASEALRTLQLSNVLVARPREAGLAVSHTAGDLPEGVNIDALLGQRNPLRAAYNQQKPILIRDLAESSEWSVSPLLSALGATTALALPIFAQGTLTAAVLLVDNRRSSLFSEQDLELYTSLTNQLGSALEHIRLLRSIEQRLAEGNLLLEFSRQLGSLNLQTVMNSLADGVRRAMPATEASLVALWDPDAGILQTYGSSGFADAHELEQISYQPGESLAGKVYASGEEILWDEIEFTHDINLRTENLRRYTQATDGRVPNSALGMPLKAADLVLGVIILENYTTTRAFTESDATFVRSLSRQAALTIQNARLYQSAEGRARQLETLANVSATITSSLDSQLIVKSMLIEFGRVLPYDSATLWLREGDRLRVVAAQGFADDEDRMNLTVRIEDSALYEEMVRDQQPILVDDTSQDDRFPSFPEYPVRAWLGIPLTSRGEVIGLLSLDNHQVKGYNPAHIEIATTLARQATVALENAQLYEQARQSSEELERRVSARTEDLAREHDRSEALLRITSELSASLDLDRVLNRALSLVNDVVGADRGVILLVAPDSDQLVLRASLGGGKPLPPGGTLSPFRRGEGLAGWVIENREPAIVPDLTRDERWVPHEDRIEEHKSALALPLMISEDALGALLLFSHRRNAFDEEQLRLVSAAANQVAAAINNAELYRLIRDQAERLGGMLRAQQVEFSKSRAILESIADGVIVTDASHQIILFNSAAERMLGLQADSVLDKPAVEFIGFYGAAGRRWVDAMQAWSQGPSELMRPESILQERLKLEDDRVVSVHLAPAVLGDEFLGTVSIFRDISREVEVDRLKSEFVATVSHELRTPMTSIKGYVEVLLMGAGGPLNDEQRRFLNIVKANTDRLGILVNDLLDISRIEAGKVDLALEPLDMRALLEEAQETLHRRIQEESKPLDVYIDSPDELPRVHGDLERVRQVLHNLVDNSFNYTPAGGRIDLRARLIEGDIEIAVADNGIGISPNDHNRIFERFYRGEQALNMAVSGTGLGLSIVQQLVEMHSGKIWVESEGVPGKGSVFFFTLPLAESTVEIMSSQD